MKDKKAEVTVERTSTPAVATEKKSRFPKTFSMKKETLIRIGVGILIALVLIPVLDWLIQTSISSRYVAFYKDADVTRSAYVKEMERQYGDQVVNEMLAKAAIAQAAKERNITVTDADVDKAIEADKARAGIQTDEDFNNALAQNGLTLTDYRAYVKVTVTLDKLIEGTVTEPTDKEISDYFTQNKELYDGKKLADVKDSIKEEIMQSSLNTKRQDWISKALAGYNAGNSLVSKDSRQYKFLRSIDLVKRLFASDPTK